MPEFAPVIMAILFVRSVLGMWRLGRRRPIRIDQGESFG
jgi:hypothetical protein